jgi:hypothetical protein
MEQVRSVFSRITVFFTASIRLVNISHFVGDTEHKHLPLTGYSAFSFKAGDLRIAVLLLGSTAAVSLSYRPVNNPQLDVKFVKCPFKRL